MSNSTLSALAIMSYRRGVGSRGLTEFIERLCEELVSTGYAHIIDQFSNIWLTTDSSSRTLFTAHTDTVHSADSPAKQEILFDSSLRCAFKEDGSPLGADDGIGIWLLLEMIYAGIPGTYVFYHGEERGGIGSSASSEAHKDIYTKFDRAIALDRAGTSDVITHQSWGRCCSDAFAIALAEQLGGTFKPCDGGVFTDTANLATLVPECTNLSVGYEAQHSQHETQDMEFAEDFLLPALLKVAWENLPTERDPNEIEDYSWGNSNWQDTHIYSARYYTPITCNSLTEFMQLTDVEIEQMVDFDAAAAVEVMLMLRDTLYSCYDLEGTV